MVSVQKIYAVWTYVSNAEQSKQFYSTVLGTEPRYQEGGWIEFATGETTFAILERPEDKGAIKPQKTRIMFQVKDIDEREQKLKQLKVSIIAKRIESYGALLTFEDPDGNWLEFYEPKNT